MFATWHAGYAAPASLATHGYALHFVPQAMPGSMSFVWPLRSPLPLLFWQNSWQTVRLHATPPILPFRMCGAQRLGCSEVRVFATWHAGNRIVWQSCTSMMFWHGECAVHGVVRRELRAAHCFQNPRLSSLFNNVTTGERELQKKTRVRSRASAVMNSSR